MRQAHLLLPSPLGLLEYDVLEEAAFVGPRRKGGLQAQPTPFPGALVAFAWTGDNFVVRPLPGETPPEVNGKTAESERALHDGDRIKIGDDIVMFRSARGRVAEPVARPPVAAPPPPPPPALGPNFVVWGLGIGAAALLLFAVMRGFGYMKSIDASKSQLKTRIAEVPPRSEPRPDRMTQDLLSLREYEAGRESRFQTLIDRYDRFAKDHPNTPQGHAAQERVRDLREKWAASERLFLDDKVQRQIDANAFAAALRTLTDFERRFGDVAPSGVTELRATVRATAQKNFDEFRQRAAGLIVRSPREAFRMLLSASHQYPADMLAPLTPLIDRAVQRMNQPTPPREPGTGNGKPPRDGGKRPVAPEMGGQGDKGLTEDERSKEEQMQAAWKAAVTDLRAGRYADALQGYTALIQQYGNTHTYRATKSQIAAGRHAAKVGVGGPAALLMAPAEMRDGRLHVEYEFDRLDVFESDWTQEEPFATGESVNVIWSTGMVQMRGGSGIFLDVAFTSDVKIHATVRAEIAKDLGLLAVEESDDYRAVIFALNNSKFRLKKGEGVAQPGHLIWLMGKGVWGAGDADYHGYIKVAEETKTKLQHGDRLQIELIRDGDRLEGSFQGKTDGVRLEGRARGDDNSTVGTARVGVFTWGGNIVVESVRIEGKVDAKWFKERLEFLVEADPGPP